MYLYKYIFINEEECLARLCTLCFRIFLLFSFPCYSVRMIVLCLFWSYVRHIIWTLVVLGECSRVGII